MKIGLHVRFVQCDLQMSLKKKRPGKHFNIGNTNLSFVPTILMSSLGIWTVDQSLSSHPT